MALAICSECDRELSDEAATCPRHTCPFAPASRRGPPVQLVETTAKRWKALRAVGWLLLATAGLALFVQRPEEGRRMLDAGVWSGLLGFACLAIGRAGAWWYHR